MTRGPSCLNTGLKKGPWSAEEDEILIAHINRHGHSNWRALPKQAGLLRCGKSCRLRWTNYLNPNIKRGNFSREEEETIIELHRVLGNKWSAIAAQLPGRTDNEIKNVWHTHLKKRLMPINNDQNQPDDVATPISYTQVTETSATTNQSNSASASYDDTDREIYVVKDEEFMEYSGEYKPEIDESFWSDDQSQLTVTDESSQIKFPSQEALFEAESLRDYSSNYTEDDLEFWCNILAETGGMTELPEF